MGNSPDRIAIFSDIHSNLEALEAVLEDIADEKITRRVCLGDIVGYGPNPVECLLRVRSLGCVILLGNHDQESSRDGALDHFRDVAQAGVEYSRKQLSAEQKVFIRGRPMLWQEGDITCVHATLADPASWDYVMDKFDAECSFEYQETPLAFCGHTHVPKVFEKNGSEIKEYPAKGTFKLKRGMQYLVNVGAVGQPRDLNKKACYVIFDPSAMSVEHRRVSYEINKTRDKILGAGLPEFLAQRLAQGR